MQDSGKTGSGRVRGVELPGDGNFPLGGLRILWGVALKVCGWLKGQTRERVDDSELQLGRPLEQFNSDCLICI